MWKVKLKNNRKSNKINLKRTCNNIILVRKRDLALLQVEWAEAQWVDQECQLQVHQQSKKVEVLTGEKLLVCCQLVRLTQNKLKLELNFGVDLITMVMVMCLLLKHKKVSEMLSKVTLSLKLNQLSWEHFNLQRTHRLVNRVINMQMTIFKRVNSESSLWLWDRDSNIGKHSKELMLVAMEELIFRNF